MIGLGEPEMRFGKKIVRQSHGREEDGGKSGHEQGIDHNFVFTGQKRNKRHGQQQQQVKIITAVLPSEECKSIVHGLVDDVIVEKNNQQRDDCRNSVGLLRLSEYQPAKHVQSDGYEKSDSEEA